MEILVFKTDLYDKQRISLARKLLKELQGILYWNVDLHDDDKILRIETVDVPPQRVELLLRLGGIRCEELR